MDGIIHRAYWIALSTFGRRFRLDYAPSKPSIPRRPDLDPLSQLPSVAIDFDRAAKATRKEEKNDEQQLRLFGSS
ncbi:uncharacterized protein QC764_0114730 [Podospora pseudoanserina]|uniref:Uncharacterized protein n=1 Tax=Podospora pseudoanserina TaxID=2609844 RepID=A0ABR0HJM8_9PEZI|nr:hypothetical protein QC764_0114730 [Podospora pseudoanserina]